MPLEEDGWTYRLTQITPDALASKEYVEDWLSGTEHIDGESAVKTRIFIIRYADRDDFYDSLMGYSTIVSGVEERHHPDPHPEATRYYVTDVSMVGLGKPGIHAELDQITHKFAKVTANYSPLPYGVGDDDWDYFSFKTNQTQEYLAFEGNLWFADQGTPRGSGRFIAAQPGIRVPIVELLVTWHKVPGKLEDPYNSPILDTVLDLQGAINSKPIQLKPGGKTYAVGTVLFQGCDDRFVPGRVHQNDDGDYRTQWELPLSFKIVDNGTAYVFNGASVVAAPTVAGGHTEHAGHNYRFNPREKKFILATVDGTVTGETLYQYADLNLLWDLS